MNTLYFCCDIPDYLHASPHYQEIVRDEPFPACGLEFPIGCVKKDMRVESLADVVELLQTLRFWLLPDLVETATELFKFCFENVNQTGVFENLRDFRNDFPFLNDLLRVSLSPPSKQLYVAIKVNAVSIVKYLHETMHVAVDERAGLLTIGRGNLECLQYLLSVGLPMTYKLVAESIITGKLHLLQYLLDQGAGLHCAAFVLCAKYGRLECMKLLMERNCPVDKMFTLTEAFFLAAYKGHIDCIEYMWENCDRTGDICFEEYILRGATEGRQVEVFQFAVANRFPVEYYQSYLQELVDDDETICVAYLRTVGITL